MKSSHLLHMLDQLAMGHANLLLGAPPGYMVDRLVRETSTRLAAQEQRVQLSFGENEHRLDRGAAAAAILQLSKPAIIEITALDRLDLAALQEALIQNLTRGKPHRVIIRHDGLLPDAMLHLADEQIVDHYGAERLSLDPSVKAAIIARKLPAIWHEPIYALSGNWPIALELLIKWAEAAPPDLAMQMEPHEMIAASGLGDFIADRLEQEMDGATRCLFYLASISDRNDLALFRKIADDGAALATELTNLALSYPGLLVRKADSLTIEPALRAYWQAKEEFLRSKALQQMISGLIKAAQANGDIEAQLIYTAHLGAQQRVEKLVLSNGALALWLYCSTETIAGLLGGFSGLKFAQHHQMQLLEGFLRVREGRFELAEQHYHLARKTRSRDAMILRDREVMRLTLALGGRPLARHDDQQILARLIEDAKDEKLLLGYLIGLAKMQIGKI